MKRLVLNNKNVISNLVVLAASVNAAAFSGVAGGFGGGFFPTGADGALQGSALLAAQILEPSYEVNMLHNIYFKGGSAIVIMFMGWFVIVNGYFRHLRFEKIMCLLQPQYRLMNAVLISKIFRFRVYFL